MLALADLLQQFDSEWTPEALEPRFKAFADGRGMKLGDVAKPARAALTGAVGSPGIYEVIWVVGKEEAICRFQDAATGKCRIKEPPATEPAAPTAVIAQSAAKPVAPAVIVGGDVEAQVKVVGDQIRDLKKKLKADGLSNKKVDANDEVKALVAQLNELKTAMPSGPASTPAPAAAAVLPSGDIEAQVKAVGDEIRALKVKLKADGLSNKKVDANDEVKVLVAKLSELKGAL